MEENNLKNMEIRIENIKKKKEKKKGLFLTTFYIGIHFM